MATKPVVIKLIRRVESPMKDQVLAMLSESRKTEEDDSAVYEEIDVNELLKTNSVYGDSNAPVILETKGVMTDEDGEISISYESRLEDPMPIMVTYSFNKKNRDVLVQKKVSFDEAVFFYETKRKNQWMDDISNMINAEATCYTKILKNYITYDNGGYIELEYFIEIGGELMEYNKEYLIVEMIK